MLVSGLQGPQASGKSGTTGRPPGAPVGTLRRTGEAAAPGVGVGFLVCKSMFNIRHYSVLGKKINFFEGHNKMLLAVLRFPGKRNLQGSEQSLLGRPHRLVFREETLAWEEDPQSDRGETHGNIIAKLYFLQ